MSGPNNLRLVTTKAILWALVGLGGTVILYRYLFGLGRSTALTDANPWGLWIGFDVLSGVALAAGGFVIAGTVHILRLKRYEALIRPAILTAFLGYLAVILGLMVDLGRPWNIWRPLLYWQTDSPLFEVAWCVMLYTTVLALEFAPVIFEGLRLERPRALLRRISLPLVVVGIGLSTLHQSSLGTLFLLARDRLHPLWDSPILPLQFFFSAVALGLVMVATESIATSWLYRREPEWRLLQGLTLSAAAVMSLYLVLRLGDLAWRGRLVHLTEGSWASLLFVVEILMSTVIPILLFTLPALRRRRGAVAAGSLLGVTGFVLHRADVGGIAQMPVTGSLYVPALTELFASLAVVAGLGLVFLFLIERFPVWESPPPVPGHFTMPMQDPVTRVYFGANWFGRAQLGALGLVSGAVLGVLLLELTAAGSRAPLPRPVRTARTVLVTRTPRLPGPGNELALLAAEEADGEAAVVPALLIDGDRAGTWVLFEHEAHQGRLGGAASCGLCHHLNLHLERGTSCATCHRDMYRSTDTYSHGEHVAALGGNRSCERCHRDPVHPKTRGGSRPCGECHAAETSSRSRVVPAEGTVPGLATGYRAALHGLCIECHRDHERKQAMKEPSLSRCTTCHHDLNIEGEPLRLRPDPPRSPPVSARLRMP